MRFGSRDCVYVAEARALSEDVQIRHRQIERAIRPAGDVRVAHAFLLRKLRAVKNRLAVVLALIIFAMVIVGWIVQLGGGLRAGTRLGAYGECQSEAHWGAAKCAP